MDKHEKLNFTDAPDHPIIEQPFSYQIAEMVYHVGLEDQSDSYIDLTLVKGVVIRRLRFSGPQNLEIEEGFPHWSSGMRILDISKRQWSNLGIAVIDFEASGGAITFWAKDVMDLDAP